VHVQDHFRQHYVTVLLIIFRFLVLWCMTWICRLFSACYLDFTHLMSYWRLKVKVMEGHTAKERRRGAHLPFIGRWARRWMNHYCLWRMASATPDLRLPYQPKLVFIPPTHKGMARLSWPGWLVTYRDSLSAQRRSPIQALTGPGVE